MEREKRLEQLQNEKRMIELEVGMKRMVFEGAKEKVKGMNSEQLMMRVTHAYNAGDVAVGPRCAPTQALHQQR